ncbi:MAG TPA: hypothetical protein PLR69_10750 [Candidatus Limiplasma sp.]|nr:hypothetical protein [Candidatus Limiplasma sp.]HPR79062.1 hypothetical protein [Candidatus Limiplasma sp.]
MKNGMNENQTAFTDFTEDYGPTESLVDTSSVGETQRGDIPDDDVGATEIVRDAHGETEVDWMPAAQNSKSQVIPVVGWLICTGGVNRGMDYRLHASYNQIGRGNGLDVMITGDNKISEKPMGWIAYDPLSHTFAIGANAGVTNFFYLNDKPLFANQMSMLNAHDKVRMGDTTLLFQPLCGDDFSWEEK